HPLGASSVIGAVVVHERPPIAKADRGQGRIDVRRPVARIDGTRVLYGVVHTFTGVLDVEDFVPESPETEQVHQRTPGDAAEGVPGDDAGEKDSHGVDKRSTAEHAKHAEK